MSVPDELRRYVPRTDLYDSLELVHYHMPVEQPPATASYIIFKKGNKTYAKNGVYGHIEYEDTDSAEIINNAISNADDYTAIILLEGEYIINEPINTEPTKTLIGRGAILKASSSLSDYVIKCTPSSYTYSGRTILKNLIVDFNNISTAKSIYIRYVKSAVIDGLTVKNYNYPASGSIYIDQSHGMTIRNCLIKDFGTDSYGIVIGAGNQNHIYDCWIENTTKGIFITNSRANRVTNNIIQVISQFGVQLVENASYNEISSNWFEATTQEAILFYDTTSKVGNVIAYNYFESDVSKILTTSYCEATRIISNAYRTSGGSTSEITIDSNTDNTILAFNKFTNVTITDNGTNTIYRDNIT